MVSIGFSSLAGALPFPAMRILGFVLLVAGWVIVVSALLLLRAFAPRANFVLAGAGVEVLGLVVVARSHMESRGEKK